MNKTEALNIVEFFTNNIVKLVKTAEEGLWKFD